MGGSTGILEDVMAAWREQINFVVARMNMDGEKVNDNINGVTEYIMGSDDAVMTLNKLIATARAISGVTPDNLAEED
jgi:hypothetical protein